MFDLFKVISIIYFSKPSKSFFQKGNVMKNGALTFSKAVAFHLQTIQSYFSVDHHFQILSVSRKTLLAIFCQLLFMLRPFDFDFFRLMCQVFESLLMFLEVIMGIFFTKYLYRLRYFLFPPKRLFYITVKMQITHDFWYITKKKENELESFMSNKASFA